jgi:hypothetical protein
MIRKGQLKTYHDAVETKAQHKRACVDCPFGRISLAGYLPSTPEEWLLAAHGEGRIECHTKKQASGAGWQCAGAAIFRTNVCKSPRDPSILTLPRDVRLVFASNDEFWVHHRKKVFPTRGQAVKAMVRTMRRKQREEVQA